MQCIYYIDTEEAITAISTVPAVNFNVDEIIIYIGFDPDMNRLIFCLILIEKFLGRIQRCTLQHIWNKEILQSSFDSLIKDGDKRLKTIVDKLGDNFFIQYR